MLEIARGQKASIAVGEGEQERRLGETKSLRDWSLQEEGGQIRERVRMYAGKQHSLALKPKRKWFISRTKKVLFERGAERNCKFSARLGEEERGEHRLSKQKREERKTGNRA